MGVRFEDNLLSINKPGIGVTCIYLFFEGIVYFLITLLIQVWLCRGFPATLDQSECLSAKKYILGRRAACWV